MKIDIITFHNTANFGATLQCTALSTILKRNGHEAEIIDYLPQYVLDKKSPFKEIKNISSSKNKIKAVSKGLVYLSKYGSIKKKDAKFNEFINTHLLLSKAYYSFKELADDPPKADLYICGSDQIWNAKITGNKLDHAYFLSFAEGQKASYGISTGDLDIEQYKEEIRTLTAGYKNLSVREKSTALKLNKILGRDVFTVLDCTLLLDSTDYSRFEKQITVPDRYLLIYNMQGSKLSSDLGVKISKERNIPIIDISPNPFIKIPGSTKMLDIGPGEFLYLFKNAEYVVTNSFHGTAFSIIYKKDFSSIPHTTRGGRITELLDSLNLDNRLVTECTINNDKVDYDMVYKRLNELRDSSIQYIDGILS